LRTTGAIAKGLAETGMKIGVEALLIVDDQLDLAERRGLRDAFGCPVIHMASRPVLGVCAVSTDLGRAYAVPSTSMLVEVTNEDGRSVSPEAPGELVLTPLHETAYPLLRFATGIGAIAPAASETAFGVRSLDGVFRRQ